MLVKAEDLGATQRLRAERRLQHGATATFPPLGCTSCPERTHCGGIRTRALVFDCLHSCCGGEEGCDRVCPYNPSFVDRVREIDGFTLSNIPRSPQLKAPTLPPAIPITFHGNGRVGRFESGWAALPLARAFDLRRGRAKYQHRELLQAAFKLSPSTRLILTGTDQDARIERWWGLGTKARRSIIRQWKQSGIELVTTPNFSLFVDRPRWDDLHAVKRIGLVHEEFLSEGLPAALHLNGRTDRDYDRWAEFVAQRVEVTHVAFEFTTGTRRAERAQQHAAWLADIARQARRPLHLILRGGSEFAPMLASTFDSVTLLDTTAFIKTIRRKRAFDLAVTQLAWADYPTPYGAPLDELLASNWSKVERHLRHFTRPLVAQSANAE